MGTIELLLWHREEDRVVVNTTFTITNIDLGHHPARKMTNKPFDMINRREEASVSITNAELADPNYTIPGQVDAIVGIGVVCKVTKEGIRSNVVGLMAIETLFGWIAFGEKEEDDYIFYNEKIYVIMKDNTSELIKKLWEIDEMNERASLSVEDQYCEDYFKRTVVRKEGRYSINIPLKPDAELGSSRSAALRRLYQLESKFKREPELKSKYIDFMREYETLGHMKRATPLNADNKLHFYIPHHAVSVLRKFRVVFDGSVKSTNGNSLNDVQYAGPRLQKDLFDILLKFRTGKIALSADIVKMFRQVEVNPEHWDLQRILWRENINSPIYDYWLTVVTYGLASSPYTSTKALIQCALDHAKDMPTAAHVVQSDFYVDDLLTTVDSEAQAITLRREIVALLRRGGFELAKWRSNCSSLMEETIESKSIDEQDSASVLGILWNYQNDEFQFKVQSRVQPEIITKRIIMSEAARIFDPQGYVSPVSIRAKLFIQELWREKCQWDQPLSSSIQVEWKNYYDELKLLNEVKISRWLGTSEEGMNQVHLFADASQKAFGIVAYVRVCIEGKWSARLLCSRSRVAPIKTVTIPRLELCAVELCCKLITKIMNIPIFSKSPIHVWTDSEIVLHWLRKPVNELKIFVANRVSRILAICPVENIRHIRSECNPADLISRGAKVETLLTNTMWWEGPPMLKDSIDIWPTWKYKNAKKDTEELINAECKEPVVKIDNVFLAVIAHDQEIPLLEKLSSHRTVCHITAYVFRFCRNAHQAIRKRTGIGLTIDKSFTEPDDTKSIRLSINEINNALNYWIRYSQMESFPEEYKALANGKLISRSSRLLSLVPWMDEDNIIRIVGRLNNADLPEEQKKPIVLDRRSILARRLAEHAHQVLCHSGNALCHAYLRRKYWILQGRILISQVKHFCATCCRYNEEGSKQFMADLPRVRLCVAPAFSNSGIDYAGPIPVKQSRNVTTKAYIAVFVCMVYKTIHLELVSSLDADSFLAALTRFVSLRAGVVRHMYSDNGRNFVGADRELREAAEFWQNQNIVNFLQLHTIQWHFNTPNAPHHGGLWEAAVKSVKYQLKRMVGAQLFTFEQLATLLCRITACLNSRPLTPMSSDPADLTTLTPGHFITGQPILTPYERLVVDRPINRLSAWLKIQRIQQEFWERWVDEYVKEQQKRNKWAGIYRSLQVGDLVFIKSELTPPCQWLMGRVMQVYAGKDGHVRSCRVKTEKSEYDRPITKLCLLPNEHEVQVPSDTGFP